MSNLEILGTGSYVPEKIVNTLEFENKKLWYYDSKERRLGEARTFTSAKLIDLTGIHQRRMSEPNEYPSDMGYKAALRALERADISPESLVGIIVSTVTEKRNFPSAAVKIQHLLDARNVQCAFDVQNACAGYPLALATANSLSRDYSGNWLVIASETLTKVNDYSDINSHLFGDGAGAAVLAPSRNEKGIVSSYNRSEPFEGGIDMIFRGSNPDSIRMPDGRTVLKRAVDAMVDSAKSLKEKIGWAKADVYIPHQANERIIAGVEKRIIDEGATVYRNISKYGNMSASTCAVALDEAIKDETIKKESKVIVTSFGSGLVTSAIAIQF